MRFGDVSVTEVRSLLARIQGIEDVQVTPGPQGGIAGIGLEIGPGAVEKRVLRDVESALMSGLGMEIDHRAVTIRRAPNGTGERRSPTSGTGAPYGEPPQAGKSLSARFMQSTSPSAGRIRLVSVTCASDGELACDVTVTLTVDGETTGRTVREADSRRGRMRAAALATVESVTAALGEGPVVALEGAEEFSVCESDGVLVLLRIRKVRAREEYYGAALIEGDEADAAARAVLDAMNRFLDARELSRHPTTRKGHD
jgi:hypothetical protein